MNDFDKAGRYLIKCDTPSFLRWLLRHDDIVFHSWIDARRVVLPNQGDLTNDLVASFAVEDRYEALVIEIQAQARADTLARILKYIGNLWEEPGSRESLALSAIGGIVVNLTGTDATRELRLSPTVAPACELTLFILQRDLSREDAGELIAGVAQERYSRWLLGWVPLMQGGERQDIIDAWKASASKLADERDRGALALIARTFAGLAKCRPEWEQALRGGTCKPRHCGMRFAQWVAKKAEKKRCARRFANSEGSALARRRRANSCRA